MLDPESSFPPNARQIALQSDSLKRSITDGVHTVEDTEMIIEAAAELTSIAELYNRHIKGTSRENVHDSGDEDDDRDPTQRLNDRDLVQHHNNQMQNDRKPSGTPKSDFRWGEH